MADVSATLAALDALAARFDEATPRIVGDIADLIQAGGRRHAPIGVPGNSTNLPGDLSASILVEGPTEVSAHSWAARVGPTTIYGRQRELGGGIVPVHARLLHFWVFGEEIWTRRVYQKPEPFMRPAYEESQRPALALTIARLTEVVEGV